MSRRAVDVPPTTSLGERAEESLQFIRRTMEHSSTFTAVPGMSGAGMGVIGLAAAVVAAVQPSPGRWLLVWLTAAAAAATLEVTSMWRKATRVGVVLHGAVGRRFATSLVAPLAAAAALTWGVWTNGDRTLLPAIWLLLYGAGVLAGGAFSIAAVRWLGVAFMVIGVVALVTPPVWGDIWLGAGFGGLHLVCGLYIARRYGG